jgi:hypothetical protein
MLLQLLGLLLLLFWPAAAEGPLVFADVFAARKLDVKHDCFVHAGGTADETAGLNWRSCL